MKLIPSFAVATTAIVLAFHPARIMADALPENPNGQPPANVAEASDDQDGGLHMPLFSALSITEETFSLPIAEADHLLHDVPSDTLRYARLRELLASSKARLERLTVLRTKSGQRTVSESIDELRYGTEFRHRQTPDQTNPADKADKPAPKTPPPPANAANNSLVPVTFETRNVGDTLELEPSSGRTESRST